MLCIDKHVHHKAPILAKLQWNTFLPMFYRHRINKNRVTTLLGKSFSMTFQDQPKQISMTYVVFHDYPGLEFGLPKSHDFPGPVVTL